MELSHSEDLKTRNNHSSESLEISCHSVRIRDGYEKGEEDYVMWTQWEVEAMRRLGVICVVRVPGFSGKE
jgi:hypothetical protein